ncbi:MAG: NAD(P)H-binding protein [candidate division Zixibacteria bacterium]|nr:NAD(P)H-binding protein [candidate division Zixibacteria bacterium]
MDDKLILIVGATGFLGRPVVDMLDHFGFPVRLLTRDPAKAEKIFGKHFDIVKGDIADYESLKEAAKDCFGVHINLKGGPRAKDFDRIENRGTVAIVEAAKERGVSRVTYLSGASVAEDRQWFAPTKAKYNAEQVILNSGLDYAIFRATWFMESLPFFVRDSQATVMGKQPNGIHWLAAEDYARIVAKAYLLDQSPNKILITWGPDEYTFKEALEEFCEIAFPDVKVNNVPLGVLKFFATVTFSKQLKEVLPLMKYFEKFGERGDPTLTDELLGEPQITLEKWSKCFKAKSKAD